MVTPASEFYPDTQSLKQATYHDCLREEEAETEMDYISEEKRPYTQIRPCIQLKYQKNIYIYLIS